MLAVFGLSFVMSLRGWERKMRAIWRGRGSTRSGNAMIMRRRRGGDGEGNLRG